MDVRTKLGASPELVITSVDPAKHIDLTKYPTVADLHELMVTEGFAKVPEDEPVNKHEHCYLWRDKGQCVSNPTYMRENCARACKGLKDANDGCAYWRDQGECTNNPQFMNVACPVSCGWREEL